MAEKEKSFWMLVLETLGAGISPSTFRSTAAALDAQWNELQDRIEALERAIPTPPQITPGNAQHGNDCRIYTHIGGTCNCGVSLMASYAETAAAWGETITPRAEPGEWTTLGQLTPGEVFETPNGYRGFRVEPSRYSDFIACGVGGPVKAIQQWRDSSVCVRRLVIGVATLP